MGVEIERKFLTASQQWREESTKKSTITQGYFRAPDATVRIRLVDSLAVLTIKGATVGIERSEWEYEIPRADAEEMIAQFCEGRTLRKTRHFVTRDGLTWEIDEFHDALEGLVVAEVELESSDREIELPTWVGEEVSHDSRYFNQVLVTAQTIPDPSVD